ncbi:MAG TPA: hypothetical protein VF791_24690 [Pyrinomonadaceae bacterium]
MKIDSAPLCLTKRLITLAGPFVLLVLLSCGVQAQSTEIDYPTPVRSNEISGTIAPRDLGDPRLTRYYYSFTGTPGDLIVTIESRNLEGDVDVFTAGALRPLAKVSMYAASTASGGSKTIYLKNRESLILRIEGRTPNDFDGSFRVRFEGTFEPIGSDVPDPEPVIPTVSSTSKTGRRVTSTGARIDEPAPEVPETKRAETEVATTPSTEAETPAETPPATAETPRPTAPKPATSRNRRPRPTTRRTTRTRPTTTARTTPTPAEPAVEPASGPRLIIETRDGMRVERFMTTVRRVTVENGQLIVVTKNGKIERQPMSNVLRMAIEP